MDFMEQYPNGLPSIFLTDEGMVIELIFVLLNAQEEIVITDDEIFIVFNELLPSKDPLPIVTTESGMSKLVKFPL